MGARGEGQEELLSQRGRNMAGSTETSLKMYPSVEPHFCGVHAPVVGKNTG